MVNERNTENIVRKHFSPFLGEIEIEAQKSAYPKVNKLLKTASKQGSGRGYPDFIITYPKNADLIIIVECKASVTKHESKTQDNYAAYAVDATLLYASYLAKDFDVLAIAVSGETKSNLRISHFLHLKGTQKAIPIFSDTLLTPADYLHGYLKNPKKLQQDYSSLLYFTKSLNDQLHTHKIAVSQRSLLISCILIALENPAFRNAYPAYKTPKNLAKSLVQTVGNELEAANIDGEKLANLKTQFAFIQTDTSLSTQANVLKELIDQIEQNINQFIKTHEYFDFLGQLYIEFLRYANSDKGLGIVLTPPHITAFFAEIAAVNQHSVVLDNCTGTGGFLIAAMKLMIADTKGDQEKIKHIKAHQLIGIEYQAHIFALAISNMYIHQDGKTNILSGSCFDPTIMAAAKKRHPTVGLLNPPYKGNKKNDRDEFEFILNNLASLAYGGTCVAIVPMQKALAQKGTVLAYKKTLLQQHTLEAVLSMPDELFFNSNVGVVTCIMVLTAHKPHPKNKATYLGYYKDDGFVKQKMQGRVDAYGTWEAIKDKWITYYQNKREEDGFSINKVISAEDEWCAGAYMSTDYSRLTAAHFEKTLLNYATFLFGNQLAPQVSTEALTQNKLDLHTKEWKLCKLHQELFNIRGSKTTSLLDLATYGRGAYPYVTTQATNNGTKGFFDFYTEEGNVLTIESAVLGHCTYQPCHFSASDHVEKLIPNFDMNRYIALFLVTILNLERYRYNYGRKASQTRLKTISIKLPVKNGQPNFEFMTQYIKGLPYSKSLMYIKHIEKN